jgi:hypothetical protein
MPVRVVKWERKKTKCKKDTTKQDVRIAKTHCHQPAVEGAAVSKRYGIAAATNKNNCWAGHMGQQLPKPNSGYGRYTAKATIKQSERNMNTDPTVLFRLVSYDPIEDKTRKSKSRG